MVDLKSLVNFDFMCISPNVEYFLQEINMKSVTNKNIMMANLVVHINLSGKNGSNVGLSRFGAFFQGGGGGTRLGKSKRKGLWRQWRF